MTYTDEAIIQLKKSTRNQQFTDIETTGIYVQDRLIQFEKQYLFDDRLAVWIPTEFVDMPDVVSQMKYPSIERPEVIKTSLDITVNFTFKWVNQKVEYNRIEELTELLKQVLKATNARVEFSQEDTIDTPSGNRVGLFAFSNNSVDEKLYNLYCVMILSEGVVLAVFNCLDRDADEWEDAAWDVLTKMEEMKEKR